MITFYILFRQGNGCFNTQNSPLLAAFRSAQHLVDRSANDTARESYRNRQTDKPIGTEYWTRATPGRGLNMIWFTATPAALLA